jgi:hypothetical protein
MWCHQLPTFWGNVLLLFSGSGSLLGLLDCADEDDTTHPPTAPLRRRFNP